MRLASALALIGSTEPGEDDTVACCIEQDCRGKGQNPVRYIVRVARTGGMTDQHLHKMQKLLDEITNMIEGHRSCLKPNSCELDFIYALVSLQASILYLVVEHCQGKICSIYRGTFDAWANEVLQQPDSDRALKLRADLASETTETEIIIEGLERLSYFVTEGPAGLCEAVLIARSLLELDNVSYDGVDALGILERHWKEYEAANTEKFDKGYGIDTDIQDHNDLRYSLCHQFLRKLRRYGLAVECILSYTLGILKRFNSLKERFIVARVYGFKTQVSASEEGCSSDIDAYLQEAVPHREQELLRDILADSQETWDTAYGSTRNVHCEIQMILFYLLNQNKHKPMRTKSLFIFRTEFIGTSRYSCEYCNWFIRCVSITHSSQRSCCTTNATILDLALSMQLYKYRPRQTWAAASS
ncbi:hypothetical protein ABW19_dt0204985 [Dactylella cylindrospora]|nr:hypothetical protein ABW19_dt0204985 [Dactylella cylindrospora]